MMAKVMPFTGQQYPIFYASRKVVIWRGNERERWVVVMLEPNGNSGWHGP